MQELLEQIRAMVVFRTSKEEIHYDVPIGKTTYTVASGGLHSQDNPYLYKATDEIVYRHWDIKSCYPFILIRNKLCPAHLDPEVFVACMLYFTQRRVDLKVAGDKAGSEIYKIFINAVTGKLNDLTNTKNWLLDTLAYLRITINGQLMILMMVEDLELHNMQVISGNTDGVVIRLRKCDIPIFDELAKKWCDMTGLSADFEDYSRYMCRDVNNYIAVETDGKITAKGAFNPLNHLADMKKGFNAPVVARAVQNYLVYDTDPIKTLRECKSVLDFTKTQNVGRGYTLAIPKVVNGFIKYAHVQRNSRYYVSHSGDTLLKMKGESKSNLVAGYRVHVLNSLDDTPIEYRDINYDYYYAECMKLITPIKVASLPSGKSKTAKYKKLNGMFNYLFDDDVE
jgi:hypothetical protein